MLFAMMHTLLPKEFFLVHITTAIKCVFVCVRVHACVKINQAKENILIYTSSTVSISSLY